MTPPFAPGTTSHRTWDRTCYDARQWALWQAFEDSYYSAVGNYSHCRKPLPGAPLDMARFETWQRKLVLAWDKESMRDTNTRGIDVADWPQDLWLYLYQRMLGAPGAGGWYDN